MTDENDKDIFSIKASCCQLAFWCNCPCDSCVTVEFDITSPLNDYTVGKLTKKGPGCCVESGSIEYNNMAIDFPAVANWKDRVSFIFVDYLDLIYVCCYLH